MGVAHKEAQPEEKKEQKKNGSVSSLVV